MVKRPLAVGRLFVLDVTATDSALLAFPRESRLRSRRAGGSPKDELGRDAARPASSRAASQRIYSTMSRAFSVGKRNREASRDLKKRQKEGSTGVLLREQYFSPLS